MNTFLLSDFNLPKRKPTRPFEQRQDNFYELFDDDTLFYDIVFKDYKIIFFAPPIEEKTIDIILANIFIDMLPLKKFIYKIYKTDKLIKLIIHVDNFSEIQLFNKRIKFEKLKHNVDSKNTKVLCTLQKNNSLEWIKDWILFYIKDHNINLIIIYDNNSDIYTIDDLKKYLDTINCKIIIVNTLFKYGPQRYNGSAFDSDFLQYFTLEHVRYKYCSNKSFLINVDIDELLISNEKPIFKYVSKRSSIGLFKGKWGYIEETNNDKKILHKSHHILDKQSTCPNKWIANLQKIPDRVFLQVHNAAHSFKTIDLSCTVFYIHFKSISTSWKHNRNIKVFFDTKKHIYFNYTSKNKIIFTTNLYNFCKIGICTINSTFKNMLNMLKTRMKVFLEIVGKSFSSKSDKL